MLRGERLTLKAREPVNLAYVGPSGTSIIKVVRRGSEPVFVRGDANVEGVEDDALGFEIDPGDPLMGVELATNGDLFIVSPVDGAQVDVLTSWAS